MLGPPDGDTERAEFIATIVQLTRGSEEILGLAERLLGMPGTRGGITAAELIEARDQVTLWRKQLDALRVRVANLLSSPQTGRSELGVGRSGRLPVEGVADLRAA